MNLSSIKAALVKYAGIAAIAMSLVALGLLLIAVFVQGLPGLRLEFLTSFPSRFPAQAGICSALIGTFWIMGLTALFSIPLGVMTGIYMEEYARPGMLKRFIQVNIANLSG